MTLLKVICWALILINKVVSKIFVTEILIYSPKLNLGLIS